MTAPAGVDPERLREIFDAVERRIEDRWGIPVTISDVPNPFTGDLDGEQILVDYDLDIEDAVFILVHLFGHTIQWNLSARSRELSTLFFAEGKPEKAAWQQRVRETAHALMTLPEYTLA